jgi:hypothetical protein
VDCLTLLAEAERLGFRVEACDGRLVIRGPKAHPTVVARLLSAKAELLVMLAVWVDADRPVRFSKPVSGDAADLSWICELAGWPDCLREAWDERAAILEFEANKPRLEAERLAFRMVSERPGQNTS